MGNILIEMIRVGATFEFLANATIALTGADMGAQLDGNKVSRFEIVNVKKGDLLELGKADKNMVAYLAIGGQWQFPEILGSASTFLRAKIGGVEGRKLQKGDLIQVEASSLTHPRSLPEHHIRAFPLGQKIRLMKSVESTDGLSAWLQKTTFTVSNNWDRMGIRLTGLPPTSPAQHILSSPVAVGTLQLPPDGQPIVVMADGQTTGGYPRIATVIKADLPYLAQQSPGAPLYFTFVGMKKAIQVNGWTFIKI